MYLTTHASVGVLISQSVSNPLEVFLLSFASHFVLDVIPHGDDFGEGEKDTVKWVPKRWKRATVIGVVDLALLIGMLTTLYATRSLPDTARISAGIIGSVLPDFLTNVFPLLHHYTNWLAVVRAWQWMQRRLGISHVRRGHDWFHRLAHGAIKRQMSIAQGIVFQSILTALALAAAFGYHYQGPLIH